MRLTFGILKDAGLGERVDRRFGKLDEAKSEVKMRGRVWKEFMGEWEAGGVFSGPFSMSRRKALVPDN